MLHDIIYKYAKNNIIRLNYVIIKKACQEKKLTFFMIHLPYIFYGKLISDRFPIKIGNGNLDTSANNFTNK